MGGGGIGLAIGLVGWLSSDMPTIAAVFVLPWMVMYGALAGGALEWQLPDESAEEDAHPPNENPVPLPRNWLHEG